MIGETIDMHCIFTRKGTMKTWKDKLEEYAMKGEKQLICRKERRRA